MHSQEVRRAVLDAINVGASQRAVAKRLGVSRGFVQSVCEEGLCDISKRCKWCGVELFGLTCSRICPDCRQEGRRCRTPAYLPSPEEIARLTAEIRATRTNHKRQRSGGIEHLDAGIGKDLEEHEGDEM